MQTAERGNLQEITGSESTCNLCLDGQDFQLTDNQEYPKHRHGVHHTQCSNHQAIPRNLDKNQKQTNKKISKV